MRNISERSSAHDHLLLVDGDSGLSSSAPGYNEVCSQHPVSSPTIMQALTGRRYFCRLIIVISHFNDASPDIVSHALQMKSTRPRFSFRGSRKPTDLRWLLVIV